MGALCCKTCPFSSPSRPCLRAAFPGMAERSSRCFPSGDASGSPFVTLSQSVYNEASGSEATAMQDSLHGDEGKIEKTELQHADHDQNNSSPLREQCGCTEPKTSDRNEHLSRKKNVEEAMKFQLKSSCVLALQRGNITKWSVDGQTDAIVNAANTRMLGGGGVDGAIHRAAGPELYEACLKLPLVGKGIRCQTGDAVITRAFELPVSAIVHTPGPVYIDNETSGPLLENSYKNSLRLAVSNGINYLAFPAISCGIYGYPYDAAAEIALNTVNEHAAGLKEVFSLTHA